MHGAGRHVFINNDDSPFKEAVSSETAVVLDAKWHHAEHSAAVEHVLTKTPLQKKSEAVYRKDALKVRPLGDVAKEFGIPNNSASQIKPASSR